MVVFEKVKNIFYAQSNLSTKIGSYLILNKELDKEQLSIKDAIDNEASFIFTNTSINLSDCSNFLNSVKSLKSEIFGNNRGILWIKDNENISIDNVVYMGIDSSGGSVRESMNLEISNDVYVYVSSGLELSYDEDNIYISGKGIKFNGYYSQSSFKIAGNANISFKNQNVGCLVFDMSSIYSDFVNFFNPGIEIAFSLKGENYGKNFNIFTIEQSLNLQRINFVVSLFACDIYNKYSKKMKTNIDKYNSHISNITLCKDTSNILFKSCYSDIFGNLIYLRPAGDNDSDNLTARFIFNRTYDGNGHCLSPEGDFFIKSESDIKIICGLSGTEYINTKTGSFIRFISGQPAFAVDVEVKKQEVGKTDDPSKSKLQSYYTSSWISVKNKSGVGYVSQASDLILYEYDKEDLLKHYESERKISYENDCLYPMLPYNLVSFNKADKRTTAEIITKIEHFIISEIREKVISSECNFLRNENSTKKVVTPNGYLMEIDGSDWKNIYLTENQSIKMFFENPNSKFIRAIGCENVFMVCVNKENIGECVYDGNLKGKQAFHCGMNIQDWYVKPNIGDCSSYGSYSNIMIIKACKGKIYNNDNPDESLCANTSMWTQRVNFSSPLLNGAADDSQQEMLANWLKDYFEKNYHSESEYFNYFNSIISDENWTGVLFLNIPLNKGDMPDSFIGIFKSLSDSNICYHHFGVEVNPVKILNGEPVQMNQGNMFGLLYYEDSQIKNGEIKPVSQSIDGDYEMKVLSLKALFSNSAVDKFECFSQITLNKIFNINVTKCANIYNCIILQGHIQNLNGITSFTMSSIDNVTFETENVLKSVCITSAEMLPLDVSKGTSKVIFQGYINFDVLKNNDENNDILSFGSSAGGLYFDGLQLNIEDKTVLSEENIKFDTLKSNSRKNSLYRALPLSVNKMLRGLKSDLTRGYITVTPDTSISSLGEGMSHALELNISLGGSGEMSDDGILTGKLLIAWEDEKRSLYVGINILGIESEGLVIQNIIKMIADKAELKHSNSTYHIVISGLRLKILGIAKLPTGSPLNMYIFGGDNSKSCGWYAVKAKKEKGR